MDVVSYLLGKNAGGGTPSGDEYNATLGASGSNSYSLQRCIVKVGTFDTSNATNMANAFAGCFNLETIELLDTKKVTNFSRMFYNCTNIKDVPQFDTSSATDFTTMFGNAGNKLTDESLNNILGMCANAVSYTGTKTLATLSLNSYNASIERLQAQPNYQSFLNAGWTIGY